MLILLDFSVILNAIDHFLLETFSSISFSDVLFLPLWVFELFLRFQERNQKQQQQRERLM